MPYGTSRVHRYGANVNDPAYGNASPALYGGNADKPKIFKNTKLKAYYTFEDSEVPIIDTSKGEYVRLIFWGGAKSYADNSSFYYGAKQVRKDYKEHTVFDRPTCSAAVLIGNINKQKDGVIQSIDLLCHGGELAVFFVSSKLEDGTAFHSPTSQEYNFDSKYWNREYDKKPGIKKIREVYLPNKIQSGLYSSPSTQSAAPAYTFLFEDLNEAPRKFEGNLGQIKFAKFTDSAKVEIHGCLTAEDPNFLGITLDSFCKTFSALSYKADKKRAIVIGHTTQSSPDKNADYRNGTRRCFHNGTILFEFKDAGVISKKTIDKYIDEKDKKIWDDYYPQIENGKETKIKR